MCGLDHFDATDRPQVVEMIRQVEAGLMQPQTLRSLLAESRLRHRQARREVARGAEWAMTYWRTLDMAHRKIRGICAVLRATR